MDIERRTPQNTAIVLIDYVSGFANLVASQPIERNAAGGRALAQIAMAYDVPLVVTMGPRDDPRGALYPEVGEILGDHPIVHRGGSFDAFDDPGFEQAVAATGRRHLVVAGLMTDGCVLHTCVSARRRDYGVSLVVDATGCESEMQQNAAIMRLAAIGVIPVAWMTLASELQRSYEHSETLGAYREIQGNSPGFAKFNTTIANARSVLST